MQELIDRKADWHILFAAVDGFAELILESSVDAVSRQSFFGTSNGLLGLQELLYYGTRTKNNDKDAWIRGKAITGLYEVSRQKGHMLQDAACRLLLDLRVEETHPHILKA